MLDFQTMTLSSLEANPAGQLLFKGEDGDGRYAIYREFGPDDSHCLYYFAFWTTYNGDVPFSVEVFKTFTEALAAMTSRMIYDIQECADSMDEAIEDRHATVGRMLLDASREASKERLAGGILNRTC